MGYTPMMATELEFFLFAEGYKDLFDSGYRADPDRAL
jgi:glutamine synthetase